MLAQGLFKNFGVGCRMEAAPSVPFHERAPDLMTEEDLQSNQLEAKESVNRLQAAQWQLPRDSKGSLSAGKADRADLAFGVPTGMADRAGPAYGFLPPGQAERANLASGTPPERAGVPFSTSAERADLASGILTERAGVPFSTLAERAQKGETSYGFQDASAYGELTSSDTKLCLRFRLCTETACLCTDRLDFMLHDVKKAILLARVLKKSAG